MKKCTANEEQKLIAVRRNREVIKRLLVLAKEVARIIKQEVERNCKPNKESGSRIIKDKAGENIKIKDRVYITNKCTESQDGGIRNANIGRGTVNKGCSYNPDRFATVTSI